MNTLSDILKKVSKSAKLSIDDAKVAKCIIDNETDLDEKAKAFEELFIGTLYVLFDYLDKSVLLKMPNKSFDKDDIYQSAMVLWYEYLKADKIFSEKSFGNIIRKEIVPNISSLLLGDTGEYKYSIVWNKTDFKDFLYLYIELRKKYPIITKEVIRDEILNNKYINRRRLKSDLMFDPSFILRFYPENEDEVLTNLIYGSDIIKICEEVYNELSTNDVLTLTQLESREYIDLICDFITNEYLSNDFVEENRFEDDVVRRAYNEDVVKTLEGIRFYRNRLDILKRRFGIGYDRMATLETVGREFGITREQVRQSEQKALRLLRRNEIFSNKFKNDYE